jgi:hypothetical protein
VKNVKKILFRYKFISFDPDDESDEISANPSTIKYSLNDAIRKQMRDQID